MKIEPAIILDIETAPRSPEWVKERGFLTPPRNFRRRENHIPPEMHWNEWHDETAQLDPARSYVCAVGLMLPNRGSVLLFADSVDDETELLGHLSGLLAGEIPFAGDDSLTGKNKIVGHNHLSFDIPYLLMRAALCGHVNTAAAVIAQLRSGLRHQKVFERYLDTKEAWQREYQGLNANSSSLDSIAATLGLPTKPGNGKDFYTWPREQQTQYLTHDLYLTGEVALRVFKSSQLGWDFTVEAPPTENPAAVETVVEAAEPADQQAHQQAHHSIDSQRPFYDEATDIAKGLCFQPLHVAANLIENWMETAAQAHRNAEYYRGLVARCGAALGADAYTDDAGGVHTDVLSEFRPPHVEELPSKRS